MGNKQGISSANTRQTMGFLTGASAKADCLEIISLADAFGLGDSLSKDDPLNSAYITAGGDIALAYDSAAKAKCSWNGEQQKCISDGCTGGKKQCGRNVGGDGVPDNKCTCVEIGAVPSL